MIDKNDLSQQIINLSNGCSSIECNLIEEMILNAADYIRSVIIMETTANNIVKIDGDELREARQSTDRARSISHDAFISSVNVVNRICDKYSIPHIYTGGTERREYGDFAIELVTEIFVNRR